METAIFLARAWGLFTTLTCLGLLINRKRFLTTIKGIENQMLFLIGLILLGIGSAQVVGYNDWSMSFRGLVTIFGWGSLVKGILVLFVPSYSEKFIKWAVKENVYNISLIVGLLMGLYLLYAGFITG